MNKNYDELLHIKTTNLGIRPDQSPHYNHYEATPYSILYTLFQEYELEKTDSFVDFGSGKGRLLYYVHNRFWATVTGIEMNEKLHKEALENKTAYLKNNHTSKNPIHIECCLAEDYQIKQIDNCFYFFNPFSVQIFMNVIGRVLKSVEEKERRVDVILYYPTKEYVHYLENRTSFELIDEVRIPGLYQKNNNERFLVYRLNGQKF